MKSWSRCVTPFMGTVQKERIMNINFVMYYKLRKCALRTAHDIQSVSTCPWLSSGSFVPKAGPGTHCLHMRVISSSIQK